MLNLNFPNYIFKIKSSENKRFIFDIIRKKFVILTPEEWVRQHVIHFLINEKKYPTSLIAVEKQLILNKLKKRTDIVVFNPSGLPAIIVECKAASVKISQDTFDQIARYNMSLNATILMVTNGVESYYCKISHEEHKYEFIKELPVFK